MKDRKKRVGIKLEQQGETREMRDEENRRGGHCLTQTVINTRERKMNQFQLFIRRISIQI